MTHISIITTIALLAASSFAQAGYLGVRHFEALASERGQNIDFQLWYPAAPGGMATKAGENGLFYGVDAHRDADYAKGQYPLVLLSHGAGGNGSQFGWIASELVDNGYIVAAPNHPGSTTGNASAAEAVKLWKRPADFTAVIDMIEASDEIHQHVKIDQIAAMGFSAGGYTALAVAGAKIDPLILENFCDGPPTGMSDCAFLEQGGIDLHKMDLSASGRDNRDPRIKAVVSIDPGVIQTLTNDSLKEINIPVAIINLGKLGKIPLGVFAQSAAQAIPNAEYSTIKDAIHFTFLPECKPAGPAILKEEGEMDPLCSDGGGRSRAEIHQELATMIMDFLDRKL